MFFNLNGDDTVPPGSGVVATWRFVVRGDATGGVFPLTVTNTAEDGSFDVPLAATGGVLTVTRTAMSTASPTTTPTAMTTPTRPVGQTPTPSRCPGDCNEDGRVTTEDLIRGVLIALGSAPVGTCASFDSNGDAVVTIDELVRAVNAAMNGCAASTETA